MAERTGGSLPKALLPIAGRPFIDLKLETLAAEGVERVVLLVGHGGDQIAMHVGSGAQYGLRLTCIEDGPALLGTAGALRRALDVLGEAFWVTYGDSYLRAPMRQIEAGFRGRPIEGIMTVLRNCDRWDRSNVRVEDGMVVEYQKGAPPGTYEYIDYGLTLLRKSALAAVPTGVPSDLGGIFVGLVTRGAMAAYEVTERFYEIGSPEGYREAEAFLKTIRRS